MTIRRKWEIQYTFENPWFSLGFHIDHQDPSITIHLPFFILVIGNCKQPGYKKIAKIAGTISISKPLSKKQVEIITKQVEASIKGSRPLGEGK